MVGGGEGGRCPGERVGVVQEVGNAGVPGRVLAADRSQLQGKDSAVFGSSLKETDLLCTDEEGQQADSKRA